MNIKRSFAATAAAATLLTGFGATAAYADEAPGAADVPDDVVLAGCTGDKAGLEPYLASVECSYKIDKVNSSDALYWKTIGNTVISNCQATETGQITSTGSYERSREWTVSGEAGLSFLGMSVSGGGSYGEGESAGEDVGGQWAIPAGSKAMVKFGQPHEVSNGTVHAKVKAGVIDGFTTDERDIAVTDWKIPNWGAPSYKEAEIVPCDQDFKTPLGDARGATVAGK